MRKLIVYALALGLIHTVLSTTTSTEAETTSVEATAASTAASNSSADNAAFGSIHGAHTGYSVWMFLVTVSALTVILTNQMRVL